MLARRLTVLCGNRMTSWESLAECAELMNESGLIELLAFRNWEAECLKEICAICNLFTSMKCQVLGGPLFSNLESYDGRFREVKESFDRVYGFLGLVSRRLRNQI